MSRYAGMPRWTCSARHRGGQVGLGELVVGGGEADLESLGFAGPAFAPGFGCHEAGRRSAPDADWEVTSYPAAAPTGHRADAGGRAMGAVISPEARRHGAG
jgi:hypothetical protein